MNNGGPPSKSKYLLKSDSEQVPWGKGEKALQRCVKRTWNPLLYSIEVLILKNDCVPFV